MNKPTRRGRMQPMRPILEKIVSEWRQQARQNQAWLNQIWKQAAGPQVSAHTQIERLAHGRLHIVVSSASWMNELTFLREKIIIQAKKIFLANGVAIEGVSFKLGKVQKIPELPPDAPPSGK